MKHIYILLLATLFTTAVSGQTSSRKTEKAIKTIQQVFQDRNIEKIEGAKFLKKLNKTQLNGITRKNSYKGGLKSASGNELKCDSTITENWIDSTSQWENYSRTEFLYDENGNSTHETYFIWDKDKNIYEEQVRIESDYDSSGNKIEYRAYLDFNAPSGISLLFKEEYTFNLHGKVSEYILTNMNWQTLQTKLYSKTQYNYNDSVENVTSELVYKWDIDSTQWKMDQKAEYNYHNNESEKITFNWIDSTSQWTNYEKVESINDSLGNKLSEITYEINDSNQWIAAYKKEYTYDTFGNTTKDIYQIWDVNTNIWVGVWKYEYFYDENGWGILDLIYKWDATTGDWIFDEKNDDAVYDENGNLIEYLVYNWDKNTNKWLVSQKNTAYYSLLNATGIPNIAPHSSVKVYPNPTSDFIIFKTQNSIPAIVDIYNLQGQLVISKKLSDNNRISVNHLTNGTYIYELTQGSQINKGKIIKN
jgi:hypothetical protein